MQKFMNNQFFLHYDKKTQLCILRKYRNKRGIK